MVSLTSLPDCFAIAKFLRTFSAYNCLIYLFKIVNQFTLRGLLEPENLTWLLVHCFGFKQV